MPVGQYWITKKESPNNQFYLLYILLHRFGDGYVGLKKPLVEAYDPRGRRRCFVITRKRVLTYFFDVLYKFFECLRTCCWKISERLGEEHGRYPSPWQTVSGKFFVRVGFFFWGISGFCLRILIELNPMSEVESKKLQDECKIILAEELKWSQNHY